MQRSLAYSVLTYFAIAAKVVNDVNVIPNFRFWLADM